MRTLPPKVEDASVPYPYLCLERGDNYNRLCTIVRHAGVGRDAALGYLVRFPDRSTAIVRSEDVVPHWRTTPEEG